MQRAKPAVQARSRETRDRLIDAMDALLQERSFTTITIADLAKRARVSPGAVYQRFPNRDAAIAILIELYMRRVEEWSHSPAGIVDYRNAGSLREALRMVALAAARQFDELHYVMRPAYLYSRLRPDLVGNQWRELQEQAIADFRTMLSKFPAELGEKGLHKASAMIAYFFNMMFVGRLLHAEDDSALGVPAAAAEFADELADFVCGYLARKDSDR